MAERIYVGGAEVGEVDPDDIILMVSIAGAKLDQSILKVALPPADWWAKQPEGAADEVLASVTDAIELVKNTLKMMKQ